MTTLAAPPQHVAVDAPAPVDRPRSPWWTALLALIPAVAVAAIARIGADTREMWEDEYATYHAITISWTDLARLFTHMDVVHALYYLFMRGWMAVAGDSLTALRIPGIAALAVAAAFTTLIGRQLVSAPMGLTAGLLFAVIPAVSRYAQEVRSYAFVTMLATIATYFFLRAMEKPKFSTWSGYVICVALAGLTHFMAVTVVGAHLLYLLLATDRQDEVRRWRFAGAIGAIIVLIIPLPGLARQQSSQVSWMKHDLETVKEFPSRVFLSAPVGYLLIGLALIGTLLLWRRNRSGALMLLAWAAGPIIFGYVTVTVLHLFAARYMLFTLPAWSLLAATMLCFLFRPLGSRPHGAAWLFGVVLGVPGIAYLSIPDQQAVRASPVEGTPSYRQALLYVQDNDKAGDGIVYNDKLGGRNDLARAAAEYELRDGGPKDVLLHQSAAQRGYFGATECPDPAPCLSGNNRLWLVSTTTSKNPWDGMQQVVKDILSKDFAIKDDRKFPLVRVVLLERLPK